MSDVSTKQIWHILCVEKQRKVLGLPGLGEPFQEFIREVEKEGADLLCTQKQAMADLRIQQALTLCDLGFDRELGYGKRQDYLDTIPFTPPFPKDYDERFGRIILVDTRVLLTKQCQLLGVQFGGNDETFVDFNPTIRPEQPVYWMSCQDGKHNIRKNVRDCRQQFQPDEVGSTTYECLAIFAQNRQILQGHYLDLPGSVIRHRRECAASLGLRGGRPYLDHHCDRRGHQHCGSVSRGEFVG